MLFRSAVEKLSPGMQQYLDIKKDYPDAFLLFRIEIKLIASTTGSSDDAGFSALMNQSSNNIITMTVTFPERSQRQRTVFEIAEVFRQYLGNRADVVFSNVSTNMGFGGSGNNNVSVEIYGYDFEATNKVAEEITQ